MRLKCLLNIGLLCTLWYAVIADDNVDEEENPPEGYYAFIQSPSAFPPTVRPPPYQPVKADCPDYLNPKPYVSANNLCGDLNRGKIYRNPMGQNVMNEIYPFELIRNQTLKFLSKTLPILKADDTLPKVTQVIENDLIENGGGANQIKRTFEDDSDGHDLSDDIAVPQQPIAEEEAKSRSKRDTGRARRFCEGGGVFCTLYRALQGESLTSQLTAERREETVTQQQQPTYHGPPTPCPAKVEYVTPVFAKNFQGSWRYVVQIPYEGYFTQTVEVTRCLQTKCHYLDGGCLSSPRWVSMLVAEIFYPNSNSDESYPTSTPPPLQDFQKYQEYLQKRAGLAANDSSSFYDQKNPPKKQKPQVCDGYDDIGCFQIRLYYDWFLVPGSCKCWRPDYFAKYVRKRPITPEL